MLRLGYHQMPVNQYFLGIEEPSYKIHCYKMNHGGDVSLHAMRCTLRTLLHVDLEGLIINVSSRCKLIEYFNQCEECMHNLNVGYAYP